MLPWLYHVVTMVTPCHFHGYTMSLPLLHCVVTPWRYHSFVMSSSVPWLHHVIIIVTPCSFHGYTVITVVTPCRYHGYRLRGGPGGYWDACRQRPEPDAVRTWDGAGSWGGLHQDTCRLWLLNTLESTSALVHIDYGLGTRRPWTGVYIDHQQLGYI